MEKILLNISVADLAEIKGDLSRVIAGYDDIFKRDGKMFLETERTNLKVRIDYPLSVAFELIIPKAICVADIVCAVAEAYKNVIYKDIDTNNKFGVWGHDIGDLYFERIDIKEDNTCELFIGS